ncbi:MAG: ergothioneine biosynthesis protein EgtB [Congregibacter sp.]
MSDVDLKNEFEATRQRFLAICEPLEIEDYALQGAVFASPPKWHLAHTSWFFETFLLKEYVDVYETPEPLFEVLFNSYYNGIGAQYAREQRGLLSRPTLQEVFAYRRHIDEAIEQLLEDATHPHYATLRQRIKLGIEHERQHQELFFTDLKYSLSLNPLLPPYVERDFSSAYHDPGETIFYPVQGGLTDIGFDGDGFCFDNELPRHRVHLDDFAIADRLVTNAEYQAFIDDGGYQRPELWLADGWAQVCAENWRGPLHWHDVDGRQQEFTLYGLQDRNPHRPVCHVSGYEAEAYASWAGARLPTEAEWETAAQQFATSASSSCRNIFHPEACGDAQSASVRQLYGDCWQWTRSAYGPYPGFKAGDGAIGEYNGKFMSNQWVLRGGSCVTPPSQSRQTYRNFFYPQDRWQFSGIRLAR